MDREAGRDEDQETGPEASAAGIAAAPDMREGTTAGPEPPSAEAPEQMLSDAQLSALSDGQVSALSEAQAQTQAGELSHAPAETPDRARGRRWDQARRSIIPAPRPIFPGLASDPRLPIWIGRGLAATAVGVAVTIWLDWRLGLTAAAVVAIADIIYRSRTTSVIPASVRVTSAQRRTKHRLALLRAAGYVALNARAIPGSDSVIDHLVIGPPGVFAVDSERWDRRLPVRTAASGRLYHGPFGQEERLEHAIWEATQASILVGSALGTEISVRPAMAIYGPTIPWNVVSLRDVDVFARRRLRKYFRRQSRKTTARLDAGQINLIHTAAAKALPPAR